MLIRKNLCYGLFNHRQFLLTFSALLFSFNAKSFVNVESLRQGPGEGLLGKTGLQVSGQQGNTNKFTSQFSTMNIFRTHKNEWLFTGTYKYGESAFLKDTNQGSAHLRHTWDIVEKTAYEVFLQSGFDEFKRLNSRNLIGANLRFNLASDESNRLYLGSGLFYEIEDFSDDSDSEGFRGNFYLSQAYKLSSIVSSSVILYYQPKLRETENYRLRLQAGLDIQISEKINLDIDANVVHDTGLPPDVKQTDLDYLVGFSVSY